MFSVFEEIRKTGSTLPAQHCLSTVRFARGCLFQVREHELHCGTQIAVNQYYGMYSRCLTNLLA